MEKLEVVQYRCPNCNAALNFEIEKQSFACEYCSSFFTQSQLEEIYKKKEEHPLDIQESDEAQAAAVSEFAEYNSVYTCPGCGAAIITNDRDTASTNCHYCHSPVILTGRLSGEYKPDYIIPFKTTKEDAMRNFDRWCAKKPFLASGFRGAKAIQNMNALYVPYWLFDCVADIKQVSTCQDIVVERLTGNNRIKHIKEYVCYRRATLEFSKIPADGSIRIDDDTMAAIEPFYYKEMERFSMSYLSGMDAEKYNVDREQALPYLQARIREACDETVKESLQRQYETIKITSSEVYMPHFNFSYALLPVWFMNFTFKGKDYYYTMNGQTGKFSGKLPLSTVKLNLFTAGLGLIVLMIMTFFAFMA